jgi:hypothetical protein
MLPNRNLSTAFDRFESYTEPLCEVVFMNIENIHAMRVSLSRMHAYYLSAQTRDYVSLDQVSVQPLPHGFKRCTALVLHATTNKLGRLLGGENSLARARWAAALSHPAYS